MFSLRDLCIILCSLDHVLRVQRIIGFSISIIHKSMKSEKQITLYSFLENNELHRRLSIGLYGIQRLLTVPLSYLQVSRFHLMEERKDQQALAISKSMQMNQTV